MANPVNVAIVGAGRGRAQLRAIQALPDLFDLVAWVDIDLPLLHERIDEAGLSRDLASGSLQETLDQRDVHAVVVATWARTHELLVGQALDAGKHVLVEKPYTLTLPAAKTLQDKADAAGLKVVVNQQWRYMPGQRTMRRLIAQRVHGEPQVGHMVTYKPRGGEYPDSEHSQLWQMTVHEIDSVIAMMGQPIVEVAGHSFRPPATTWRRESTATAELTFQSGARVAMVSTSDSRQGSHEFRIECSQDALVYRNTHGFGGVEQISGRRRRTPRRAHRRQRRTPAPRRHRHAQLGRLDQWRPRTRNQRPPKPPDHRRPRRPPPIHPLRPNRTRPPLGNPLNTLRHSREDGNLEAAQPGTRLGARRPPPVGASLVGARRCFGLEGFT